MLETTILASGNSEFSLLIPALPDLIWGTVAFIIVAVAVYKLAWPTFIALLDERTEKIENGLQAAQIARAEIANEREVLSAEVVQAQRDAAEIRQKAQENAKTIVLDAQTQGKHDAKVLVDTAHQRIEADTQAAARVLRADVGALATELAGRIVGEALADKELSSRVIDRFLDELEVSLANKDSVIDGES